MILIISQITINISENDSHNQETQIRIPIQIKRDNSKRWKRAFISFFGAVLLGLSGVISCIPTWLDIVLFVLGSGCIASTWVFSKGD